MKTTYSWFAGKHGVNFIGLREETICRLRLSTREHRTVTFDPRFTPSDANVIEDVTLRKGGVVVVFQDGGLLSEDFRLMGVPMNYINPKAYPKLEERALKWIRDHPASSDQYGFNMSEQIVIATIHAGIKDDVEQLKRHKQFLQGSFFKIEL